MKHSTRGIVGELFSQCAHYWGLLYSFVPHFSVSGFFPPILLYFFKFASVPILFPSFSHSSNKTPRPRLDGKRLLVGPPPTWDKTRDGRELVHADLSCFVRFFGHSFTHYIHSFIHLSIHSFNVNLSFLGSNFTSICYYFPSLIHAIVQLFFLSMLIFSLFLNILSFIHLFQQVFSSSIPPFIRAWFIDFLCSPNFLNVSLLSSVIACTSLSPIWSLYQSFHLSILQSFAPFFILSDSVFHPSSIPILP